MTDVDRAGPEIVPVDAIRGARLSAIYGPAGLMALAVDVILTRLFFRGARIVRRPVRLRGRRHISLGRGLTVGVDLRIDAFATRSTRGSIVRIGEDVEINDHVHIAGIRSVVIGDGTLIASRVFITDHNHGDLEGAADCNGPAVKPAHRPLHVRPVQIGANVWLGEGVIVLPGVTIGDGAIIGGGSVVARDVPAGAVAIGAPARVVRQFDPASGSWSRVGR